MNSPFDGIELLPNPHKDRELIPCPHCGAEYCLDGIRSGPATIMFTKNAYRVICVECWHKGKLGRNVKQARHYWNQQTEHVGMLKLREQSGMTQQELAEKAGIGAGSISRLEIGRIMGGIEIRQKIAAVLNVSVSEL